MFCQILGECGPEEGSDPSSKNMGISKSAVYSTLRLMGFNISSDNTITLNITNQLKELQETYGDEEMILTNQEIDDLFPNINLNYFNITGTDKNGNTVTLDPLNIDLNGNLTDEVSNLDNVTITRGNRSVDPSEVIKEDVNVTVS